MTCSVKGIMVFIESNILYIMGCISLSDCRPQSHTTLNTDNSLISLADMKLALVLLLVAMAASHVKGKPTCHYFYSFYTTLIMIDKGWSNKG